MIEPATQNDVDAFFETVAQAPKSALLLDYDGTLAPFRVERDKATPYAGVTSTLQQIQRFNWEAFMNSVEINRKQKSGIRNVCGCPLMITGTVLSKKLRRDWKE